MTPCGTQTISKPQSAPLSGKGVQGTLRRFLEWREADRSLLLDLRVSQAARNAWHEYTLCTGALSHYAFKGNFVMCFIAFIITIKNYIITIVTIINTIKRGGVGYLAPTGWDITSFHVFHHNPNALWREGHAHELQAATSQPLKLLWGRAFVLLCSCALSARQMWMSSLHPYSIY